MLFNRFVLVRSVRAAWGCARQGACDDVQIAFERTAPLYLAP